MEYKGVIAALGNPGPKYRDTRHNCGFMLAEKLLGEAREEGSVEEINGKKFNCLLWRVVSPDLDGTWLLAEPQTFMKESGRAVQPALAWFNLKPSQLVVVQDELDIPAGALRFKFGGGLAGHNGLSSIAACLGSADFYRLRIGIGRPPHKTDVINWVLSRPDAEDREKIDSAIDKGLETLSIFSREGLKAAELYAKKG
ncbi:MAG: aminoacyl-tRNA hydrolase [Desulfovibrio sp.]|nr:aminoacyl-tRNA hydrolase [Desulfovibrio sp.]